MSSSTHNAARGSAEATAETGTRRGDANGAAPSRLMRDLRTLPNLMSLSRLAMLPAAFAFYFHGYPVVGLAIGFACGISDYLDGWLARRSGKVTELGTILDRLGDLVAEVVAFIVAVYFHLLSPYYFVAYVLRELVVLSARQYVVEHRDRGVATGSSIFGKIKTNALGYSFLLLFAVFADVVPGGADTQETVATVAEVGIGIGLVASYISGAVYLSAFARTYDRG